MFSWFFRRKPVHLPFSTDIHCHLVPGVDDGSPAVDKSVGLLRHMERWGLTRVVPTPHVTEDTFENTPATIDPAYGLLVAGARDAGVGIELMPASGEYRMDNFLLESLSNGLVRALPGNYLLVENSFGTEPFDMDSFIFDLSARGYRPVLAHPERYVYYHDTFDRYRRLHDCGLFMQCNVLSFAGYYGRNVKLVANRMLENGLVDFMGTDVHGMRHVQAIEEYMSTGAFRRMSNVLKDRLLNDRIL